MIRELLLMLHKHSKVILLVRRLESERKVGHLQSNIYKKEEVGNYRKILRSCRQGIEA